MKNENLNNIIELKLKLKLIDEAKIFVNQLLMNDASSMYGLMYSAILETYNVSEDIKTINFETVSTLINAAKSSSDYNDADFCNLLSKFCLEVANQIIERMKKYYNYAKYGNVKYDEIIKFANIIKSIDTNAYNQLLVDLNIKLLDQIKICISYSQQTLKTTLNYKPYQSVFCTESQYLNFKHDADICYWREHNNLTLINSILPYVSSFDELKKLIIAFYESQKVVFDIPLCVSFFYTKENTTSYVDSYGTIYNDTSYDNYDKKSYSSIDDSYLNFISNINAAILNLAQKTRFFQQNEKNILKVVLISKLFDEKELEKAKLTIEYNRICARLDELTNYAINRKSLLADLNRNKSDIYQKQGKEEFKRRVEEIKGNHNAECGSLLNRKRFLEGTLGKIMPYKDLVGYYYYSLI